LLNVLRYVERNPLRAGLVRAVDGWPWSSLALLKQADRPYALRRCVGPKHFRRRC
jgi:hypothetical protein